MPRHLSLALETITAWPRLEDRFYTNDTGSQFAAYPPGGEVIGEYLHSIGVWQQYGLDIAPPARAQIRELWKHRLDLRYLLGEAIGHFVCEEFLRPFLRHALAGGRGAVARWVAAFPELRAPLLEHYRELTGRFKHPFEVVYACRVLTRDLGEPPTVWRAAALAIHHDDRRQSRLPPWRQSDFLRHDLETHGTVVPGEGAEINQYLAELGGEPLDVMQFGFWWHPYPLPRGEVLARVAAASRALAGARWDEEDIHVYARALAALDWRQVARFVEQQPTLRAIAEAAGALTGRAVD